LITQIFGEQYKSYICSLCSFPHSVLPRPSEAQMLSSAPYFCTPSIYVPSSNRKTISSWPYKMFRNSVTFYNEKHLALHLTRKVNVHLSQLFSTSYTVYCHLTFISGGLSAIHNLKTRRAAVKWTNLNCMKLCSNSYWLLKFNIPETVLYVKS
jgi:hypothetical protein